MRAWRLLLIGMGTVSIGVGGWLLLTTAPGAVVSVGLWALGPVAVHDLLVAPVAVCLAWLARRVLPRPVWAPVTGGVLVSAGLVLVGLVVVGRPGALADTPSLLDRDYATGLGACLAAVWVVVALLSAAALHRSARWRSVAGSADYDTR